MRFFSGKLFSKSNRKLFSCVVCIAWYKHSRGWENSWQLCKPSTSSRVCITVSNSPNPSRVYIRLCTENVFYCSSGCWFKTFMTLLGYRERQNVRELCFTCFKVLFLHFTFLIRASNVVKTWCLILRVVQVIRTDS